MKRPLYPAATPEEVTRAVHAAAGRVPGSLVLQNARVVDVFAHEITPADVLIAGRLVAAVGRGFTAAAQLDLQGAYVLPGLIDAHMHIESSLVEPGEYARAVVPRGVTTVVADPHEIANVVGRAGIDYMLRAAAGLPLNILVTVSSCVPATPLETAGAAIALDDMAALLERDGVVGVAELMNFPALAAGDPEQLAKAYLAEQAGLVADGHAPGLTGAALAAYAAAGVLSDHESTGCDEALAKLRAGLTVFIREGSVAKNLAALLPLVRPETADRFCLVTDDVDPLDLVRQGSLDHAVRQAIGRGLDPITAIRLATLNPARYFGLRRRGAVAPGYVADLLITSDLQTLKAERVLKDGRPVAADGRLLDRPAPFSDAAMLDTVRLPPLDAGRLALAHRGGRARAIGLIPGQIVTDEVIVEPKVVDGCAVADPARDLVKLAVVERHGKAGRIGLGLLQGLGLRRGALASTVAHDSHNLILAGVDDADMVAAARAVAAVGGGFCVAAGGEVQALLPLPVAGLMAQGPLEEVVAGLERVHAAAAAAGVQVASPFLALSFLALTVIPTLKLSDHGLVNAAAGRLPPFGVQ